MYCVYNILQASFQFFFFCCTGSSYFVQMYDMFSKKKKINVTRKYFNKQNENCILNTQAK